MQLVTTILPVLRQRGVIARFFSTNLSLTLRQPELTRRSSLLHTKHLSENSELQFERYPGRQFPSMYIPIETRFFWKRYTLSDGNNRPPEYIDSWPLLLQNLFRTACTLKEIQDFMAQMNIEEKCTF